jgi:hypothetical protein
MIKRIFIFVVIVLLAASCKTRPRGDFATLTLAVGEVAVIKNDGTRVKAIVEQKLYNGDRIETGNDSGATMQLGETIIKIGPDSELEVVKVLLSDNAKPVVGKVFLSGGILKIISTLDKERGDRFQTETVNLVAAVRGTEFNVERSGQGTRVECHKGSLEIRDPEGERASLILKDGEFLTVNNDGTMERGELVTGIEKPAGEREEVEKRKDLPGSEKVKKPGKREPTLSEKPSTGVPSP